MEHISDYLSQYVSLLGALLTPVIAAVVAFIAYQQYRIRRFEVKMKLYDKRYAVFEIVMGYLSIVVGRAGADMEEAKQFLRRSVEARFLFDQSVENFIVRIYRFSIEDRKLDRSFRQAKPEQRDPIMERQNEVLDWFHNALEEAKQLFDPYLNLTRL